MKRRLSPVTRLSIGLAALTVCLLLGAELVGFLPSPTKVALEARQKICESLALQLSWAAVRNDRRALTATLSSVVANNPDILSAALKSQRKGTIVVIGDHAMHWTPREDGRSTPTDVQVPIFNNDRRWGVLELSFEPLQSPTRLSSWMESTVGLLMFVGLAGFGLYFLFLRRALRELDPSRVIPDHVKAAFDALAEGVLIVDEDERIVLANRSFMNLTGYDSKDLTGRKASDLEWEVSQTGAVDSILPWQLALSAGVVETGVPLRLPLESGEIRTFLVNGAPITDGDGNRRGALATFDDVSDLQQKNVELRQTLETLAESKEEVKRQNSELRFLATRDPLTRCLNRRAMFESFERLFDVARRNSANLACIMIDIDHFKKVNDHYGHVAGDKIIRFVAKALQTASRTEDIVARYGGEEFCIIMPGVDIDRALVVADRLRLTISEDFHEKFTSSRDLTVSMGIAMLQRDVANTVDLLNRADQALYSAKRAGRNRVIKWSIVDTLAQSDSSHQADGETPDTDQSMLVEKLDDCTQTLQLTKLSDRVVQLDAMIEEKSVELHQKHGFDEVTGLPNRILFYDRVMQSLAGAQRDGQSVAVLYLDLDLLQRVDDQLEPVMGDRLLKAAAERVASVLRITDGMTPLGDGREGATLSRLGNNEFGIALPRLANTEAVTWIIQRLFDSLITPIIVEGNEVYANCSVGISLYPSDGEDVETLVRCASTARHHAQARIGRHKFMFYAQDMNERSYEHMQIESQLRVALERDEFTLHYQPAIDLRTGKIVAMEALVRWENPEVGMIGPDMFIPIAEHTGLIGKIGDWVLRTACQQMKQWVEQGITDVRMAVNMSAVQLRSKRFAEDVVAILDEVGLDPKYLELEITETALMENVQQTNETLQKLRSQGVYTAMDDFGTGYSSLSHLKHLVVDKLKIDRSFIRDVLTDPRDAAVVSAVIAMAKLMDMEVVAEGVETDEQLDFLRKRQCDMAQGFLLSRPLPAAEIEPLLKRGRLDRVIPDESGNAAKSARKRKPDTQLAGADQ